jgi:hypothetical protein
MGQMQEMIYTNSKNSINQGIKQERERVLRMLVQAKLEASNTDTRMALYYMIKKVKGEYIE